MKIEPDWLQKYQAVRRDIHAHPEMAYQEFRTSELVADTLNKLGLTVTKGIAETGVVGLLDRGDGPFIGFRADMDALPITEMNQLYYRSTHQHVMHACGHDGHTTMLLAAAELISQLPDLKGKIAFVFQPAEENEGGAKRMVEEGVFEQFPVQHIFGIHNMPGISVDKIVAPQGPVSAAFAMFDITIVGQGGHGAMPEQSVDPMPAASALIAALNSIVSRNIAPQEAAVVTIGDITSHDSVHNVIPSKLSLKGSCRSLNDGSATLIENRIRQVCEGMSLAYQLKVELDYQHKYPSVFNEINTTQHLWQALAKHGQNIELEKELEPIMGSEDFSFFSQQVPGCFFLIGNGSAGGPLHSPTYNFDDRALPTGINAWVSLAKHFLQAGK